MKRIFLGFLILSGCGASPETWVGGSALVGTGSIVVLGRTPVDAVISIISGQDCSVVRLDKGKSYCKPEEPPPDDPPFCTRSLGSVDCWTAPVAGWRGVADGPTVLTPAQEADRVKGWLW